jgi:cytochrome c peroxidase
MDDAVRDMALYQGDVKLASGDVKAIVAFLRTLTGEYNGVKLTSKNEYGVVIVDDHH